MTDWTEHEYDDGWALVRSDCGDHEIVDIPAQCPTCPPDASIDFWWDGEGIPHCQTCDPPGVRSIRSQRMLGIKENLRRRDETNRRVVKEVVPEQVVEEESE
jgi:hypothetical protein